MSNPVINAEKLLSDKTRCRLMLRATLVPVAGNLFQPAGFPEIGHVIYDAPRVDAAGNPTVPEKVCIVDSAASMANHLEAVSHQSPQSLELHEDLAMLPHIQCLTDDGWPEVKRQGPHRLVVTSLSEGHRLASSYFLDAKARVVTNGQAGEQNLLTILREEFGMPDLGKKTHPLPGDWWSVFRTIFQYDPNSLVHGILFPALGIKIARVLTAHHEAFGAARVGYSGVKFDKLGKTTSGQPIFAVDQETAPEIRATFIIDLALVRSFGYKEDKGLNSRQKQFLIEFAFWKIGKLLESPHRFRSNCDLQCNKLVWLDGKTEVPIDAQDLCANIKTAIEEADFGEEESRVTKVYWPAGELFKAPKEDAEAAEESGEDELEEAEVTQ